MSKHAKKLRSPKPKPQNVVCDVCELPWSGHGDEPTLEDCIGLLKGELVRARRNPFQGVSQGAPSQHIYGNRLISQ